MGGHPPISTQPTGVAPLGQAHQLAFKHHDPMLSAQMCWDAIATYGKRAGMLHSSINGQHDLVDRHDTQVAGPAQMQSLPANHSIGFYDGDRLAHVMVSTGHGYASGNKNDCVGVAGGTMVGWQNLDLVNGLQWDHNGQVVAQNRVLTVVHRPLAEAGQRAQPASAMNNPYGGGGGGFIPPGY
ncbi:hypothetical protein VSR68_10195 [Paraburkholderia phymatum]|uniref:hypothetical protein n=1 Tax=Paraburkholderia phymatum TaxID=148447 RepID=UPI003171EEDD